MFTFPGGTGHFLPLLPAARAIADPGHEILLACREGSVGAVRATGGRLRLPFPRASRRGRGR